MWTLFLIITLNADLGGISSHEIATFEKLEDFSVIRLLYFRLPWGFSVKRFSL